MVLFYEFFFCIDFFEYVVYVFDIVMVDELDCGVFFVFFKGNCDDDGFRLVCD